MYECSEPSSGSATNKRKLTATGASGRFVKSEQVDSEDSEYDAPRAVSAKIRKLHASLAAHMPFKRRKSSGTTGALWRTGKRGVKCCIQ